MRRPAHGARSRGSVTALSVATLTALFSCTAPPQPSSSSAPSSTTTPAVVSSKTSPARALDYGRMKIELQRRFAGGDVSMQAVRAVVVTVDGRTVLTHYRNRRPTDRADTWSVTKSVISILVGIAVDEGRLPLDQTLGELLPSHAGEMSAKTKSITLRQLLTMTSGISGGDRLSHLDVEDPIGSIVGSESPAEPSTAFLYSNSAAHLLSAVLRQAVDRPVLDYARTKLFDPLGIETRPARQGWDVDEVLPGPSFGWASDRDGTNNGCCMLKLTAVDMAKIGQLYLDGGRWRGRQLVSARWVHQSTVNQLTAEQIVTDGPYGYLWWIGDVDSHPYFAAIGSYGQHIIVFPDHRLVVVTAGDESGLDSPSQEYGETLNDVIVLPILSG